jgi:hypothetical protein
VVAEGLVAPGVMGAAAGGGKVAAGDALGAPEVAGAAFPVAVAGPLAPVTIFTLDFAPVPFTGIGTGTRCCIALPYFQ